ncbi:hypothetical protein [Streptomyces mirabilis]|uniref:hypothetical protein n=1 Tax=Streptomyces mirabilis TaxID=68239 RepID=UPI0033BD27E5
MGHGLLPSPCPLRRLTWTPKEREAYTNDLDDPRAFIAVSAASNRSKADKDPTQWLPPYASSWCTYVTSWIADKTRYQLTFEPAEQTALAERLAICPEQPITITLAR